MHHDILETFILLVPQLLTSKGESFLTPFLSNLVSLISDDLGAPFHWDRGADPYQT